MGENHHQSTTSRFGARNSGEGEIVEVQGGHIVRSTGRKDRHSKVCTAKGPRDRRVRLAAHTAIQFYDVQDRLGYDRPSKAVDWLIKKAKAAIDELAELPAWTPTATPNNTTKPTARQDQISDERDCNLPLENLAVLGGGGGGRRTTAPVTTESDVQQQNRLMEENPNGNSSFLPPSLDSDAIADTRKSFFPMCASVETSSSSIQLENYPPDLLSRTSSQNQDLRLSLQSFQEPILLQQQQPQNEHHAALFAGNGGHHGLYGHFAGWSEHHQNYPAEISRFQRMLTWNASGGAATDTGNGGASGGASGGGGFIFSSTLPPPPPPALQPLFGQNQLFSQRGPLQSSNTPSIRAWIDPAIASDHHHLHNNTRINQLHHPQSAMAGIGFTTTSIGGFSGFRVPARIQGEEEEHVHGEIHNKPTSASSNSRH